MTLFWQSAWQEIKTKLGTVLLTAIVTIATIFSDHITSSIRDAINRSDQRPIQQEKLAKDLAIYLYSIENLIEFSKTGLTSTKAITSVSEPYNKAIETLRGNEYAYYSAVALYWGKDESELLANLYRQIKDIDKKLHALNTEYFDVLTEKKAIADQEKVLPLAIAAEKSLEPLQLASKTFLLSLSKH